MSNAERLHGSLRKATTHEQCIAVVNECDKRCTELRGLIAAASMAVDPFPMPARRAKAIEQGPAAVEALDREIEEMEREGAYLVLLRRQAYEKAAKLREAAIREQAPKAKRRLPDAVARVRKALADLDASIAALSETLAPISELASLSDEPFPLSDRETADVLELREAVWTVRNSPAIIPAGSPDDLSTQYPLSFAHMFDVRSRGETIFQRVGPPQRIDVTDIGAAVYR
jgi:uncharacterized protein YecA (UPF0149 family)